MNRKKPLSTESSVKSPARIVSTVSVPVTIHLNDHQLEDVRKAINVAVCGAENCNTYDDQTGRIVPAFPPEIDNRLKEAHYGINASHVVKVVFDVDEEGNFVNFRF